MNAIVWLLNAFYEWFKNLGNVDKDCDCECVDRIELTCIDSIDRRNLTCFCEKNNIILRKNDKGRLYINIEQLFYLKSLIDKGKIKGKRQKAIIRKLLKVADRRL